MEEPAMHRLHGVPASSGAARGALVVIAEADLPRGGRIDPGQADGEIRRLGDAAARAGEALDVLAADVAGAGHPDEAGIFGAQAAMARDPALVSLSEGRIRGGDDAIAAVRAAG